MSTYTVEVVNSVEDSAFDRIYNSNSSTIDSNMGYSDKDRLKEKFSFLGKTNFLLQVKNNNTVVLYARIGLSSDKKEVFITNIINDSNESFFNGVEVMNSYFKSNGVEYVMCESTENSSMYNSIIKSFNRPDLLEYDSNRNIVHDNGNIR